MDITELVQLETEHNVAFVLRPDGESFVVKGKKAVVKQVLGLIEGSGRRHPGATAGARRMGRGGG